MGSSATPTPCDAKLLEATARTRTKVHRYRAAYAAQPGIAYAFLPCVMSTSGRIHGEFLRLLYILAHRRTVRWFAQFGDDHPSDEVFKFRRGQSFWHTRAAIGHAAAHAVAQRTHVAEHTLRRFRAGPNTQNDLLYPPMVPLGLQGAPDCSRALVLRWCLVYSVGLLLAFRIAFSE